MQMYHFLCKKHKRKILFILILSIIKGKCVILDKIIHAFCKVGRKKWKKRK